MNGIYVFLNGARGIAVLESLKGSGHTVAGIIMPPKCADEAAIRTASMLHGLEPRPVSDVNAPDFINWLHLCKPELSIVAGYSSIFGRDLIELPKHGTINLHGGWLPKYRGGSPLNWQIANGETFVGCSILQMDEGIDTGPVLSESRIDIGPGDDIAVVHALANRIFQDLVLKTLNGISANNLEPRIQNETQASYWHQRNDMDGRIRWAACSAHAILNLVRAVPRPYPGAFCFLQGQKLRIFRCHIPEMVIHGIPGRVVYVQGQGPHVICSDRSIVLDEYVFEEDYETRLPNGAHLTSRPH